MCSITEAIVFAFAATDDEDDEDANGGCWFDVVDVVVVVVDDDDIGALKASASNGRSNSYLTTIVNLENSGENNRTIRFTLHLLQVTEYRLVVRKSDFFKSSNSKKKSTFYH